MCIHFLLDIGLLNVNLLYVLYILSIYYAGDNLTLYEAGAASCTTTACRYQIIRDQNNQQDLLSSTSNLYTSPHTNVAPSSCLQFSLCFWTSRFNQHWALLEPDHGGNFGNFSNFLKWAEHNTLLYYDGITSLKSSPSAANN